MFGVEPLVYFENNWLLKEKKAELASFGVWEEAFGVGNTYRTRGGHIVFLCFQSTKKSKWTTVQLLWLLPKLRGHGPVSLHKNLP